MELLDVAWLIGRCVQEFERNAISRARCDVSGAMRFHGNNAMSRAQCNFTGAMQFHGRGRVVILGA